MGPPYALSTLLNGGISFYLALFEAVQAPSMQCTLHDIYLTTQISFEGKVCKLFASMIDSLNSSLSRCLSKCWLHADKFDHTESKTCESGFQWTILVSQTALETGNKSKKTALWNKMHVPEFFLFVCLFWSTWCSLEVTKLSESHSTNCPTLYNSDSSFLLFQSCVWLVYAGT